MCPDCREPLAILELEGVEIDRCLSCGGTWLDAGELEMIGAAAGVPAGEVSAAVRPARSGRKGRRRCPRCRRRLRAVVLGKARPVELDRCPAGHGLWLDRGELEAAIASLETGEGGAVARFFSDAYRKDLGPGSPGKKGV